MSKSESKFKFESLLGEKVLSGKTGKYKEHNSSVLDNKYVGLYFSAHWCPPCRAFTPKFAKFYEKYNGEKPFDVVFISSDKNSDSFDQYFSEMPWKALPFDSPLRKKLGNKFKVEGIPTLVILSPEGKVLTTNGVEAVAEDDLDALFPAPPLPAFEVIGDSTIFDNQGNKLKVSNINQNEVVGFYFSAHWCGPCRRFTPELIKAYNELKKREKKFDIVFCSSDSSESEYKEYFATMPWKSLGFKSPIKEKLSKTYNVEGIPTLVLVDKKGEVISTSGRSLIEDLDSFPWTGPAKPLLKLNSSAADFINSEACVIVLVEEKQEAKTFALLEPSATEFVSKFSDPSSPPVRFILAAGGDLAQRVSAFLKISAPAIVITHLSEGEKWVPTTPIKAVTREAFEAVVKGYLFENGKGLTKKSPKD